MRLRNVAYLFDLAVTAAAASNGRSYGVIAVGQEVIILTIRCGSSP